MGWGGRGRKRGRKDMREEEGNDYLLLYLTSLLYISYDAPWKRGGGGGRKGGERGAIGGGRF